MRPTYSVPLDDGSRRSLRFPPSNPLMALPSHPAQASAWTAHPSGPSMHAALMGRVSPLLHQPGSMTDSPPTTTTMGGEYGPTAAPPMPSAQASPPDCLAKGLMAPSPATTEAAMPLLSSAHPFLLTRSSPTHPLPTMGGSAALAASRALLCSQQCMAFTMSTCPGFADANPWVIEEINAVAHELQCWYQRHSICWYLAWQTRWHLATTTIQCWKRHICLDRWFAQQALQRQKRLRLQLLCRGTLAYAVLVWGDCRPPPTPTNKTSDPKVLRYPFRDRGLPLPRRRRARQNNCPRCRPGQRHWPRAPNSGGGPLCMSLCFLAAQSAVAASELCVGTGRSLFSPYLPPHTAATAIQRVYRSYVDKVIKEYFPPHTAATAIQCVYPSYVDKVITEWLQEWQAMPDLSVCDSYWIPRWDDR